MDDIGVLRELLGSVYLTQNQKAALGRVLGTQQVRRVIPLSPVQKANLESYEPSGQTMAVMGWTEEREPRLLNEAEKEREQLLGKCGAE